MRVRCSQDKTQKNQNLLSCLYSVGYYLIASIYGADFSGDPLFLVGFEGGMVCALFQRAFFQIQFLSDSSLIVGNACQ